MNTVTRQQLARHCRLRSNRPCVRAYAQNYVRPRSVPRYASLAFGAGAAIGLSFYFFYPDPSRSAPTSKTTPLSPSHFTPSRVLMNEVSGPDTRLIELIVPPELLPRSAESDSSRAPFAPIWSVYIKDDDIQVERPYTPLEGVDEDGRMLFWVKKYPKGEVGRWLHSKTPGETVELRGPLTTWPWRVDEWDEIVMISGGTGITPFYQLFHSVISRPSEHRTRFTLLHSSRTPADIPPPRMMNKLSTFANENPERFQLELFVDSNEGGPSPTHIPTPTLGRIGKPAIEQCLGLNRSTSWWQRLFGQSEKPKPSRKVLFLVCGPDPMIHAIAGPFGRNFSQGVIKGVLGEMGFTSSEVYKL